MLSQSSSIITRENLQIIKIENAYAEAKIALFGGHLLSFKPKHDQRERLWLSQAALLDGKHAIRGGVPICWPWFGEHAAKKQDANNNAFPSHGYVRTQTWQLISITDHDLGTQVILEPQTSKGNGFSGTAQLRLVVDIAQQCSMQLHTINKGQQSLSYTGALHSYFAISDINKISLSGLSGSYFDKTRAMQTMQTPVPYRFNEETDRVHLCQTERVVIEDGENAIAVNSSGHDSTVVWNPWHSKSVSMQDMPDLGYLNMVCVESAITQGQEVLPGETHILGQIIG